MKIKINGPRRIWPHRLLVKIDDFQSSEQGSIPCGATVEGCVSRCTA